MIKKIDLENHFYDISSVEALQSGAKEIIHTGIRKQIRFTGWKESRCVRINFMKICWILQISD